MGFSADLLSRARALKRVVVLPESDDERVLKAASKVLEIDGAKIILLGKKDEILARGGQRHELFHRFFSSFLKF